MPIALEIRKLHTPPGIGRVANNLPVDEVADSPEREEKGRWNHHLIGEEQIRMPPPTAEDPKRYGSPGQHPVRGHSAMPVAQEQF